MKNMNSEKVFADTKLFTVPSDMNYGMALVDPKLEAVMIDSFWGDIDAEVFDTDWEYCKVYRSAVTEHLSDMEEWLGRAIANEHVRNTYMYLYERCLMLGVLPMHCIS